jgi:lipopolysaccharide transport system permease protein
MAGMIEGFRSAFLGRPFNFVALAISLGVAFVLFLAGVAYFEKVERRFADII